MTEKPMEESKPSVDKANHSGLDGSEVDPDDVETGPQQDEDGPRYSVFTTWQKRALALAAALTAFFSPLTAQIYLPALNSIASDLGVTSAQINLTITTYMIFQGITPMFVGALADGGGRRPAYLLCFVIYIAANIGIALAPDYGTVLGLRCLQSAGSSPTIAICSAVIADFATSAERGTYIGIISVPAILAPSLGPVIGGLLSQHMGWRSVFWFLTIIAGITLVVILFFFPETCRLIVGDGSIPPPPLHRTAWQMVKLRRKETKTPISSPKSQPTFKFKMPNVLDSLFMILQKETGVLLGTSSITFAGFYAIATAMPSQFSSRYGLNETEVGLMYLPLAAGSIITAAVVGPLMGWNFRRYCAKLGLPFDPSRQMDLSAFPIERVRLEIGVYMISLAGACIIAWGWSMDAHAHLAVPIVVSVVMCFGMMGYNNTIHVLLVDIHPGKPGTATAANNFLRCLLGAGVSAAIVPMIDGIGIGWTFTILGGINVLCIPFIWLIMGRGIRWRAELEAKARRQTNSS